MKARLSDVDSALAQIEGTEASLPALIDLGVSVGLSFAPPVAAAFKRLGERKQERDVAHLRDAIAALTNAIAAAADDIGERLETDPRFIDFVDRLVAETLRAEQREKVEYYARLLRRSAPQAGPDEDERIRLLDALDELRPHHLRLFHALATTTQVPDEVEARGSVWETLHAARGIDQDAAQRDLATLERLQLIDSGGWPSVVYLRAKLTEFGLRFEAYVASELDTGRQGWGAKVDGDAEALSELVSQYTRADLDPSIARELGGLYVVSQSFDGAAEPAAMRESAEGFLQETRLVGALVGSSRDGSVRVTNIVEFQGGRPRTHLHADPGPEEHADPERWPTPRLAPLAYRLAKTDEGVARGLSLSDEGSWAALVRCMNLIEGELGGTLADYPGVNEEELARFDAAAFGQGLDRPASGRPGGAMNEQQAGAFVRQALKAYIYIRAGVWTWPAEPAQPPQAEVTEG